MSEEPPASRRFAATTMRGKTAVTVTTDRLVLDDKRADVYPLRDAALGPWTIGNSALLQGFALHLASGRNRLVLGGLDYRVPSGTPLDAPPADVMVDAWVSAADFDEIVTAIALHRGWNLRRPEPGRPTRCSLVPNTSKGWDSADWPWQDFSRRRKNKRLPTLALDVGNDAIWVIDPATNAVVASASVAQVTATPRNHSGHPSAISETIAGVFWAIRELERPPKGETAVLVIDVPGAQRLVIACPRHFRSPSSRFDWDGDVPREHALTPNYLVSGADWWTLAEKFGLAPQVIDSYNL